ncbi:type 1 glutamine amidotransferase [Nocardioides taihuensis]|uniref:Type 1 glutamine amidotransferase n=1 Tax=Nocardioides taihuensis TaxID=1835606 RepID=A0ABW0BL46_9ACTN
MRALVIQHDHVSPPGAVGRRLEECGVEIVFHEVVPEARHFTPDVRTVFPDVAGFDLVVAMGAPWSVYDEERIGSWVSDELDLLRHADASGVPVLGICFGGQLVAAAHGGAVVPAERAEIGWAPVRTDDPSLVGEGPWFQWHMDRWDLPGGAREIARNDASSQAFVLRRNLAVQFHPELDAAMLDLWLTNGGAQVARAHGRDPDELLAETVEREQAGRTRAAALVDGFLDRVSELTGH